MDGWMGVSKGNKVDIIHFSSSSALMVEMRLTKKDKNLRYQVISSALRNPSEIHVQLHKSVKNWKGDKKWKEVHALLLLEYECKSGSSDRSWYVCTSGSKFFSFFGHLQIAICCNYLWFRCVESFELVLLKKMAAHQEFDSIKSFHFCGCFCKCYGILATSCWHRLKMVKVHRHHTSLIFFSNVKPGCESTHDCCTVVQSVD